VLLAGLGYVQPFLAWVAFVPLLVAARRTSPGAAIGLGLLAGWCFEVGTTLWFIEAGVSLPAYLLLTFVCALRFGVLAGLAALPWGSWSLLMLPGAWVLLEYLRIHLGPFSAGWGLIGYSQASFLPAARIAADAGVYGVSFAIVAVNVALGEMLGEIGQARRQRPWRLPLRGLAPGAATILATLGLVLSHAAPEGVESAVARPSLRVAAVQGGIHRPGSDSHRMRREVVERYQRLTRELAAGRQDLVIWPEAALPAAIPADASAMRAVLEASGELGVPLLVGASGADKTGRRDRPSSAAANSAFLVEPAGRIRGRYDKVRLLPFNEYVPLRGLIDWPAWIVASAPDAVPGTVRTRFELGDYRFSVLICWENLFPHDFRSAAQDVDFMVSLTNEAFTRSPVAHRQLLDMNVFRAIESGVWIVRAATTADSSAIAPSGELVARVVGPAPETDDVHGTLSVEFVPQPLATPYRRFGDWFVALQALLLPAVALGRWGRRVWPSR
jgi:apolipoprotein N-acyltransferase